MNDETVAMIIVLPTIVVLGILAFWELGAVREP